MKLYQTSFALRETWRICGNWDHTCEEAPEEGRHEIDPRREQEHRPIADGALPLERSGDDGRLPRKLGVAQLDDGTRHVARGEVAEPHCVSEGRRAILHDIDERFGN